MTTKADACEAAVAPAGPHEALHECAHSRSNQHYSDPEAHPPTRHPSCPSIGSSWNDAGMASHRCCLLRQANVLLCQAWASTMLVLRLGAHG